MVITISNTINVSNPTKELKKWCKDNLVIPNPEYSTRKRMGFWTGNISRTLSLYQIDGGDYILPYGVRYEMPMGGALCFELFSKPTEINFKGDKLLDSLYDYQKEAVEIMANRGYGILQSAAGSGKTQMGIALACKLGLRTLWLCHTKDLINQSKERAELYIDKSLIGTITGGKVNIGKGITFATIQTMCNLDLPQYKDIWDVIIVDEVHRVSGSPTSVTQYMKVLNALSARHKYGLSATVHRADGMIESTFALVGKIVHTVPDEDVADKVMRVGIVPIDTGVRGSREMFQSDGMINYTQYITSLSRNRSRTQLIVNTLIENKDKSSLILSSRIELLKNIIEMLPDSMKKDTAIITGKMTTKKGKAEREQAIEDMRQGKKKYLFASYNLAKEGLDVPRLERLYMTTPQTDFAVITQSIGRVARTFKGKSEPLVYDFVDNIPHSLKAYKKRCTIYRKNRCYFVEGEDAN